MFCSRNFTKIIWISTRSQHLKQVKVLKIPLKQLQMGKGNLTTSTGKDLQIMNKMKNQIKIRKIIKVWLKMMTFILTLMNRSKLKMKKKNSMEVARKRAKQRQLDQLHQGSIMKNQNMKIIKKQNKLNLQKKKWRCNKKPQQNKLQIHFKKSQN